jgi:hypothetical protein
MEDFNIIEEGQKLGVVDANGRIVVNDVFKVTTSVSMLMKLIVLHLPQVKVVLDNINPKNTLVLKEDEGFWCIRVGDFKKFLSQYFQLDVHLFIPKPGAKGVANATEICGSIFKSMANNSARNPTDLAKITIDKGTKLYWFDMRICLLTYDQLNMLLNNTKKTVLSNTKVKNLFKAISQRLAINEEEKVEDKIELPVTAYDELVQNVHKVNDFDKQIKAQTKQIEQLTELVASSKITSEVQDSEIKDRGLDRFVANMNPGDKFKFTYEKAHLASSDE